MSFHDIVVQDILPVVGTLIAAGLAWLVNEVRLWASNNIKQRQLGILVKFAVDCVAKFGPDIQKTIQNKEGWPQLRDQIVADLKEQSGPFIKEIEGSIDLGHFVDAAVKKLFGIDLSNPAPAAVAPSQTAIPVTPPPAPK